MNEKNKFGLTYAVQNNVLTINISGYLDAHTAPELENAISDFISRGHFRYIINFKDLDYISSAGLGVFMAFIEEIRDHEGDIKMSAMNTKVFSVFDLLGFPILFDIVPSDDEAMEKFNNGDLKKNEY